MLLFIVPIHLLLEGRRRLLPLAPPQHQVLVAPKIPGWCGSSPAILRQKEPTQYHQPTPVWSNWAQCGAARHTQSCELIITRGVVMIIVIIINPGDLSSWKGIQATQFGITSTGTDMGLLGRDGMEWESLACSAARGCLEERRETGLHLQHF